MRVVLTVLAGVGPALLAEIARDPDLAECRVVAGVDPHRSTQTAPDATEVTLEAPRTRDTLNALARLRTAVAAHLVIHAPTPRPTGLLASEAMAQFDEALAAIAWQRPRVRFTGLRLDAAGADSPQMQRIAAEFAQRADVPVDEHDGDLHLRVRRTPGDAVGWQGLVRTTPRPLATRAWRTERYPGALNATIAAAVIEELGVAADDTFADLMCGSGTLVIERMARGPAKGMLAVDHSPDALAALTRHLRAARLPGRVEQELADVREVGGEDGRAGTLNRILANPPWGELLGEHETNETLYSDLLDAVDRVGTGRVRAGILTHDIRRFEGVLATDGRWRLIARPQFFAKGHRPRLFVLERRSGIG